MSQGKQTARPTPTARPDTLASSLVFLTRRGCGEFHPRSNRSVVPGETEAGLIVQTGKTEVLHQTAPHLGRNAGSRLHQSPGRLGWPGLRPADAVRLRPWPGLPRA